MGRLTFVSERACRRMFGFEPRELIGKHVADFNGPGFTRREFLRRFSPVMHGRPVFEMEAVMRDRRGEALHVSVSSLPILNEAGQIQSVTGVCADITALKQRERELNVAMRNQQAVFDAAGEGIVFVRNGKIEGPNRALARMLGLTRERWSASRRGNPGAAVRLETIDQATRAAAVRGEGRSMKSCCAPTTPQRLVPTDVAPPRRFRECSGGDRHYFEAPRGISLAQANHDEPTGPPNRRPLGEHARRLLSVAMQKRRLAAVLVLDLDGFKEINDLFGHSYGDNLLKRVALRLSGVLRDYDVVARTGGDEFVVLLPEIEQPSIAMVVAEKLIAGASENVEHQGRSLRLHASVGLALFPSDGHDFETLLAAADDAMYAAKAAGKNRYQLAADVVRSPVEPAG
jgi:diguanylate cyclase (GGDEF)-like protein/PAS domain S-box-containing protein